MKTVEILLKEARLQENGTIKQQEGNNKIFVTLHNSGVPNATLVSSREAGFEDENKMEFAEEYKDKPELLTLFRAHLYSKGYVEVEITSIVKPTKAAKVLYKLLSGVAGSAIGFIPGGDIVTAVAKIGSEAIFKTIKPEDDIQVIAHGRREIDPENLPAEITIDLKVPQKVKMSKVTYTEATVQSKGKKIRKYSEQELAKDMENGTITLLLKEVN
jgi:hypothetical protein